ncbi:hypothetical protein PTKIN_Ptkin02bG0033400 [Pterospermum kingtungense]
MLAKNEDEESIGNLNRFRFEELAIATTNNFSNKRILGMGCFGNVYKGHLKDGTVVAVKRLKDGSAAVNAGGETQFQADLKDYQFSHKNILQFYGFCMTATERLLVLPLYVQWKCCFPSQSHTSIGLGYKKKNCPRHGEGTTIPA